jgi:glycosyltransferase involved in cell wall biosynthesis
MTWALVAGEYPPQHGGVADYTYALARALAARGDDVHVFAPPWDAEAEALDGVVLHRLPDGFGRCSRQMLESALADLQKPRAVVVQYVPQSFGMRGCNLMFVRWLQRLRGYPLFVMFHEVSVTVGPETPLKYRVQAIVTRLMAASAIHAADAIFASTPIWISLINRLGKPRTAIDWTPVPSNIALSSDAAAVDAIRRRFVDGDVLLGHFGTFREAFSVTELTAIAGRVVAPGRSMLFMGRGSDRFVKSLHGLFPNLRQRIHASGALEPQALANHLAACDLLIQPLEDGVSARRGSIMAAIALGVPVATVSGWATEPVWKSSSAVALAATNGDELVALIERLIGDPAARSALKIQSKRLYDERFAIEHTVDALYARLSG